MSGTGRPSAETPSAAGMRVAIAATRWNAVIVDTMVQRAEVALAEAGGPSPLVVRVAGAVELPVVCQQLARDHDVVVALGVVIRGGTPHFEYVCDAVTAGLTRVALDESTPVGNGVLTCENEEQAIARSGHPGSQEDKGHEAMTAAIDAAALLRHLRAESRGGNQA